MEAAEPQLLELARAMRPEWDHDVLAGAIRAARTVGWTWVRTFNETCRLLTDEDASPWDLKRATASPFRREHVEPGTTERGAALARQLLTGRTA